MKRPFVLILLISIGIGCGEQQEKSSEPFDHDKAVAACEKLLLDFQGTLKRELMAALAEGGPEKAISVCRMRAPAVADSFSQMAGVKIKRVSLRQRNPECAPDDFELTILNRFDTSASSDPQVRVGYTFDSAGVKHFRYMQEIRVGQPCLKCHGNPQQFSPSLKAVLADNYPNDPAVGYKAGDHRGAFSIIITDPDSRESTAALLDRYGR